MKKNLIKTALILFVLNLFTLPLFATADSSVKVVLPKKTGSYVPGDNMDISWVPSSEPVQRIILIPSEKSEVKGYPIYSDKVYGDPIITSGKFKFNFENYSIPSGSYYVGISSPNSEEIKAQSSKKIKVEDKPSLYFGTASGEVNSVAISKGKTVILKWEAKSVKKCEASSYPLNSKWKNSVKASGTKKIHVLTPTTFYLNCKNNLGEVNSSLDVDTQTPEYSNAKLIPNTTFLNYNFNLGTTQQQALSYNESITLFNSSNFESIYYRIISKNKPDWINTGYSTSQLMLSPNGTTGIGAFADPSKVTSPGKYTWDLKLEGNFENSPLIIPVTMTITR